MITPFRESANDELLSQAAADPFRGTDCEIPKDKTNATVRLGIIKIRKGGRREISPDTRVVRLPSSVIAPRHEGAEYRMPDSRAGCTSTLVEVTGILMEQGR